MSQKHARASVPAPNSHNSRNYFLRPHVCGMTLPRQLCVHSRRFSLSKLVTQHWARAPGVAKLNPTGECNTEVRDTPNEIIDLLETVLVC